MQHNLASPRFALKCVEQEASELGLTDGQNDVLDYWPLPRSKRDGLPNRRLSL